MSSFKKIINPAADALWCVIRILVGILFAWHGAAKFGWIGTMNLAGFAQFAGLPVWLAAVVALGELLAGLCILLGLFVRLGAVVGMVVMLSALTLLHFPQGWNVMANGGEPAVVYLASFIALLIHGAGKFSLEKALLKKEHF